MEEKPLVVGQTDVCVHALGGREVPESVAEVSRSHLGLHDGLVPALAEGRSRRRLQSLPRQLRHGLHDGRQARRRADHGRSPGMRSVRYSAAFGRRAEYCGMSVSLCLCICLLANRSAQLHVRSSPSVSCISCPNSTRRASPDFVSDKSAGFVWSGPARSGP